MPVGKEIYSAEPGDRLREGKYILHEMRVLFRHTCYAQVLISQPLSSSSALRIHTFRTLAKNSETFVLLMGMFFQLVSSMVGVPPARFHASSWRPSYSILVALFRIPRFELALRRALSFVSFAAACIPCDEIQPTPHRRHHFRPVSHPPLQT